MGLLRKRSDQYPLYGVRLNHPAEPPSLIMALQLRAPDGEWRPPRTRKEARWVIENNLAMDLEPGWTTELVEFKPGKRWKFESKGVKQVYPHLEWSDEDQRYIDPTKIAPEAAGWTQEEADAGRKTPEESVPG